MLHCGVDAARVLLGVLGLCVRWLVVRRGLLAFEQAVPTCAALGDCVLRATDGVAMVDMAKRRVAGAIGSILGLLLLAGCTVPVVVPPIELGLEVVDEDQGWVQVRVIGVTSLGYTLRWGDADTPYGLSSVLPPLEFYEHFYQAVEGGSSGSQVPRDYEIALVDSDGGIVAQESVHVERADCHLSLVTIDGRMAMVRYWGRFGIDYSISWGDQSTDHVTIDRDAGTGLAHHTYGWSGTFILGMGEIWAPLRSFLTVTVE